MRIDAHQHFWQPQRGDYGWLQPELKALYRDFLPEDLQPLLAAARIDGTVLVQAAPTEAETRYLLRLAERTPWILGVVGWVELDTPDAAERIFGLAREPRLRGIRPMLQDLPDPDWILAPSRAPALAALERSGLVFDALIHPRHLGNIVTLARRYPRLAIVIDHAAKPAIDEGWSESWAEGLAEAALCPNVSCKLSGLPTQSAAPPTAAALKPYFDHLLRLFGPARLLWGSDWPVLTLAADYGRWLSLTEELLAPLPRPDRDAILGGTAARIYRLLTRNA
jgi:L-fuconolactonase